MLTWIRPSLCPEGLQCHTARPWWCMTGLPASVSHQPAAQKQRRSEAAEAARPREWRLKSFSFIFLHILTWCDPQMEQTLQSHRKSTNEGNKLDTIEINVTYKWFIYIKKFFFLRSFTVSSLKELVTMVSTLLCMIWKGGDNQILYFSWEDYAHVGYQYSQKGNSQEIINHIEVLVTSVD